MKPIMNAVVFLVQQTSEDHFWGTLTIKFENGNPVLIRKEQNIKPNDLTCQKGDRSFVQTLQ